MNKKVLHLVYGCFSLLLAMAFAGCTQEENLEAPSGLRIALKEFQQDVHARTIPADLEKPLAEKFDLKVKESVSGRLVHEGKVNNELIPLSTGTYEVTASYGKKNVLAIDAPAYEGTSSVTLKTNEEKTVNLTCGVANALLSVKITNPTLLEEQYSEYKIGVRVNNNAIKIGDFKKSIYFPAGSAFSIFLEGRKKTDGSLINNDLKHESIPATCKAGDHIILTLTVSNAALDVSKVEVRQEEISATIPMEWLPKPRIQAEAGFLDNALTLTETETKEARLKFLTASPLQDVKLKFHFGDEALAAYNDTEYLLSNPEHKTQLEALGMVLPEIGAATSAIDFKALTAKLQTNAGATTTNTVEIDVKANNRWSSENKEANRTYTFNCNKPEFNVSVSNGNIWTKEFTINPFQATKGNQEKLSSNMIYQISENKELWNEVSTPQLLCQGLTPGKTYFIRSLYRGAIASSIAEVTTYPEISLPNGDMEQWRELQSPKLAVGANLLNRIVITGYYPNNSYWSCVNKKTFEGNPNINSTYNQNPSTIRVAGKNGGYAAALRTVGWDNNLGNSLLGIYHIAAGKIFIGTYDFQHRNGPEQYNYGMNYVSKPTEVKFFYKYEPYNNDAFKAWIVIENRDNGVVTEIGRGEVSDALRVVDNFKEMNIPITYTNEELKPTHMYIVFSSSARCSDDEATETANLKGMVSNGNYFNGSLFTVDDISLVYDK